MSTPATKNPAPIIVRKKISHGGHHGGAWKVAYADFVTAMMSLFIVLWLMNTSPQVQKAVAGYFNDPKSSGKLTGTTQLGSGQAVSIDKQSVERLKEAIEKAILKQADLTKLSNQIEISITNEGLKIELIEDKGGTFFQSGSPQLSASGIALLSLLAGQLKTLPNHLLIEGHTDAQPYSSDLGYTNWELSSDRANSARRILQQDGVGPTQISQVRGYADQSLRIPGNPLDPSNRRISLIVQWVTTPDSDAPIATSKATPPSATPATSTTSPGNAAASTPPAAANTAAVAPAKDAPSNPQPAGHLPTAPAATQTTSQPSKPPASFAGVWLGRIKTLLPAKKN